MVLQQIKSFSRHETVHRIGENIYKSNIWQRVDI